MATTRRLGKGLDALLPPLEITEDDKVIQIDLKELRPNPYQPRKTFTEESIEELAASIKEHGVIQPIIVRKVLKGYEIIAGERRYRAAMAAKLDSIPAVVREFTDQQVMEIALIENIQREDLNAIEVANAYQALIDQFHLTQEELSVKVGKSRSHIANFLRLLQLPEEIKNIVSRGTLTMGHARALVGVQNKKLQKELAELTIRHHWSVRELEEAIQKQNEKSEGKSKAKAKKKDPYIARLEEMLQDAFKTTVKVKHNKNKGKIEFSYYSEEDLERLLDLFHVKTS